MWVDAFIRRLAVSGHYAAVIASGNAEAGAVYVVINRLDGGHDILAPPPGPAVDDDGERRFEKANLSPLPWPEAKDWLARRRKSDSDIWIVEAECRTGYAGLLPAGINQMRDETIKSKT
jgi:hypothetical protein